ncbi:hypothetical protein M8845_18985 [Gelidibacter japonicus]|uniref:hypothetical protein n=1 Tax=Gelidibacter japonicus TaxID=1962232 RepID=UPI0020226597|nr:hypothetical protein [Gelidibacter japonicus]MCL8009514.1 hypothetical protein [Gelidibacter japonicus]
MEYFLTSKTDDEAKVQIINCFCEMGEISFSELMSEMEKLKDMTFDRKKEYVFREKSFRFIYNT